ncbi:hypothetical protein P8452_33563 [Trifolium repens]|nr:hypothetical protein P8452_33563 [Trifolium repens]
MNFSCLLPPFFMNLLQSTVAAQVAMLCSGSDLVKSNCRNTLLEMCPNLRGLWIQSPRYKIKGSDLYLSESRSLIALYTLASKIIPESIAPRRDHRQALV